MNDDEKLYYVYQYQGHMDWLGAILPAKKTFCSLYEWAKHAFNLNFVEVVNAMLLCGWEGDGTIGVIWIPDFIGCKAKMVWHVKQSNNGTSFIASSEKLNFKNLMEINYERE